VISTIIGLPCWSLFWNWPINWSQNQNLGEWLLHYNATRWNIQLGWIEFL